MKVDSQSYSIKDIHRPTQHWGVMNYVALCIVCERCVTVCQDMVGSNALSTGKKRPSDAIEKHLNQKCQKMHTQCGIN